MPAWSVLLRLLLCLSLVLNGAGAAAGAVHATSATIRSDAHRHDGVVPGAMAHANAPCHGHHRVGEAGATGRHGSIPMAPDCCKSSACDGACTHAAPVAASVAAVSFVRLGRDYSAGPYASGHLAPDLPHLIRPPIG